MYIEKLRLRNFRCFGNTPEEFSFDPALTAIVGANGAGKTAIIGALMKLFGTRAEDRRLTREDVHFGRDEEPGAEADANAAPEAEADPAAVAREIPDDLRDLLGDASPAIAPPPPIVSVPERQVEIEVTLAFPELDGEAPVGDVVPEIFRAMSAAGPPSSSRSRV